MFIGIYEVGQLGLGNNDGSLVLDDCDHIIPEPNLVKSLLNITVGDINAGWGHSLVVSLIGNVYMWS